MLTRRAFLLAALGSMAVATRALFTGSIPARTPGTWTPDGSPQTIEAGDGYQAFPAAARLTSSKLLLAYQDSEDHVGSGVAGRIGTVAGTSVSWGSPFSLGDRADTLSVIDGRAVITGRTYDPIEDVSTDPFVLVCDDLAADMDAESTWTEYPIAYAEGIVHNVPTGRLIKVGATYLLPVYHDIAGTYPGRSGVLLNDSLTDWSDPTYVEVTPSNGYTEMWVERLWGEYLLALIRTETTPTTTSKAISTDGGATWSSVSAAHDGAGLPMFRRLTDSTLLTVYRDSPLGDTAWRTSGDNGASWSSEVILDTEGTTNEYATMVQLDHDHVLVVYALERSETDADIYSQVFTRS